MHQIGIGCRKEKKKRQMFSQALNILYNNINFYIVNFVDHIINSAWCQQCCLCKSNRKKKKKDQNCKDIDVYTSLYPVNRGRKLNVHKTFRRRPYVRSIYVLVLRGSNANILRNNVYWRVCES